MAVGIDPRSSANHIHIIETAKGQVAVDARLQYFAAMAEDAEHGDTKAGLSAHRVVPCVKAGDTVILGGVWDNFYGRWARIRTRNGDSLDVRTSVIIVDYHNGARGPLQFPMQPGVGSKYTDEALMNWMTEQAEGGVFITGLEFEGGVHAALHVFGGKSYVVREANDLRAALQTIMDQQRGD